ncbi:MAG: L-lactate permease [Verrucomicrobiales bacterium]|nr:L-lactate permease [Verrucomicrobiales bacterium]
MIWAQQYNPLGHVWLSTLVAFLPVAGLLGMIATGWVRIHWAAFIGLGLALAVAGWGYGMPVSAMVGATLYGAAYGLFPIGWIVLNVLFFYHLTVRTGLFEILRDSLSRIAPDPRVQLILIAFSLGAFIEGVAGFGTPVAITGAILIQLRFKPLDASVLALIANTAPVAFGSLGIPITTLSQVTGMDVHDLSKMAGRQLPVFSLMIPFWVVAAYSGWRGMLGVWPVALAAGLGFAVPQFLVSNFHGPWLVDNVSGACSMGAVVLLLRFWKPGGVASKTAPGSVPRSQVIRAWMPWIILSALIFFWGLPQTKNLLDGRPQTSPWLERLCEPTRAFFAKAGRVDIPVSGLDGKVQRVPPVAPAEAKPEKAVYTLNWLSATGTGILLAGIIAGLLMGCSVNDLLRTYGHTLVTARFSLLTIAAMLALGHLTKYAGIDATLGLFLAGTGIAYPFFGTLLGWLGVALTGSDTASNVLFGSLQKITSEQLGLSPVLMGAANSTGGVMGKMIDAQSIVVASTATGFYGREGEILRRVFWHSLTLACLVGIWVTLLAYVPPFSHWVIGAP